MELTILLPCLNEAQALPHCIGQAQAFLRESGVEGEVLLADNGSTDGSPDIARALGARVLSVPCRGYGAALQGGIADAGGEYVILADCDGSYDLLHLQPFLDALRRGGQLVMGDRYGLGFAPGASPWTHRYLGVPVLSSLGRLAQRRWAPPPESLVHDFHCGLRAVHRASFLSLNCRSCGMEFASEMVLAATAAGQRILQVPCGLGPDLRGGGRPHLHALRDGLRHLQLLASYRP